MRLFQAETKKLIEINPMINNSVGIKWKDLKYQIEYRIPTNGESNAAGKVCILMKWINVLKVID